MRPSSLLFKREKNAPNVVVKEGDDRKTVKKSKAQFKAIKRLPKMTLIDKLEKLANRIEDPANRKM